MSSLSGRNLQQEAIDRLRGFNSRFNPTLPDDVAFQADVPDVPDVIKLVKQDRTVLDPTLPIADEMLPTLHPEIKGGDRIWLKPIIATGFSMSTYGFGVKIGDKDVIIPRSMVERFERGAPQSVGDICRHRFADSSSNRYRVRHIIGGKAWFEAIDTKEDDFVDPLDKMIRAE